MTIRKPQGRRLASLLLTLTLLLTLVPALDTPARAEEQAREAIGLGTKFSPYVVYTYEQLWNAMDYRGDATGKEYIQLGCDIDTSTENGNYGLAADMMIRVQTYNHLTLDLNGHTLTVMSSDHRFQDFILQTGNMTICDGSSNGGGKILLNHARAGDHMVVRIVGGYTLTLKDGVTLEVGAPAYGACINAVLWLSGNAHAVIENANLLYTGERDGETGNPRNWATGVLVEDSATLTIQNGEFTRVVVNKPPVAGGDKDPSVVINGGTFRRPLAILAGDKLDKTGPLTLPIRINGGVFNRIEEPREWYKRDAERQFYIHFDDREEKNLFVHFDSTINSSELENEVRDCMKTMYRSLFPDDVVMRWEDSMNVYQKDGVAKIDELVFSTTFYNHLMYADLRVTEKSGPSGTTTDYVYPDQLTVYSGLFDMKAEYGGEDALTGTPENPIITDLTENSDLKVTWNAKLPADLANNFRLAMYYVVDKAYYSLTGTGNSDGTRTATVVLPGVTTGNNYQVSFVLILAAKHVGDPTQYPSALAAKTLWLRSLKTQTINGTGYPYELSGPLKAGDTVGPDLVGEFPSAILAEQGPWTFNTGEENGVPVSEQKPIPAGRDCYKKVTLNAAPGYRFSTTYPPSIMLQRPDGGGLIGTFPLTVSADGKTATGEVTVWSTAIYEELKLTIPNVKAGNVAPTDQRSIFGLPEGITPEGNIAWKEDYGSGESYLRDGDKFYAGHTYRCELFLHPGEGVTVPETVKATINGITADYAGGYSDGNFTLTSEWFIVPDPRTPIEEITLRVEDDPFNYLTSTVLLTPLSTDVTQTVGQWYNSEGEPVNSGSLPPNAHYSYKAVYEPRSGFRFKPDGFRVKIAGEDGYLSGDRITVTANRLTVNYDFIIPAWSGTTIQGAVYSYGSADDPITVTMKLQDGTTISGDILDTASGTGEYLQHYFLAGVPAGIHTMTVTKAGHNPYVWEVEIKEGFPALMQTVWLSLEGSADVRGQFTSYGGKKTYEVRLVTPDGQIARSMGCRGDQSSGLVTDEFVVKDVSPGTYDLEIIKAGHLDYTIKNVVVKDGKAVDLAAVTLLCGDLNGDGFINSTDLGIVLQGQNYGKAVGASDVNPLTDLNGDGWVNSTDLGIILQGQHYGKSASADCTTNYGGGA